jgi:hypothetical protein
VATRKKIGRPTKYTDEVANVLVEGIATGRTLGDACAIAGIDRETVARWIRKGDKGEEPFAVFATRMREAWVEYSDRMVRIIEQAAESDWKAAAWTLERRRPLVFGKERLVPDGLPARDSTEANDLSPEELRKRLRAVGDGGE